MSKSLTNDRSPWIAVGGVVADQNGMSSVDAESDVGVGSGAEHRKRSRIRVQRKYLIGGEFESAVRDVGQVAGEEGEPRSCCMSVRYQPWP